MASPITTFAHRLSTCSSHGATLSSLSWTPQPPGQEMINYLNVCLSADFRKVLRIKPSTRPRSTIYAAISQHDTPRTWRRATGDLFTTEAQSTRRKGRGETPRSLRLLCVSVVKSFPLPTDRQNSGCVMRVPAPWRMTSASEHRPGSRRRRRSDRIPRGHLAFTGSGGVATSPACTRGAIDPS